MSSSYAGKIRRVLGPITVDDLVSLAEHGVSSAYVGAMNRALGHVSVDQLVALHAGREYTAYFLGFLPGFAYCGRLDPRIVAPRLARPRERVPAGSVAVADGQTAVYPLTSPGGWRLIGRTDIAMFDAGAAEPVRIRAGDRLRFVPR